MEAIPYVDRLVSEYLLFRGFATTFQAFNSEKASDRGCGYQAEQISNLVFGRLIPKHDGRGLFDLLAFLKTQVFSKLDSDLESSAAKIELSILRLYIVQAIEANKAGEVQAFYTTFGEQLSSGRDATEWEPWFSLPFLQKPQKHPRFQVYFTKPWKQLTEATFRNYMANAILQLPLPAILRFHTDWRERQHLRRKVESLQAQLSSAETRQPLERAASAEESPATSARSWSLDDLSDFSRPSQPAGPSPSPSKLDIRSSGAQVNVAAGPPHRSRSEQTLSSRRSISEATEPRRQKPPGRDAQPPAISIDSLLLSDMSDSDMEANRLVAEPSPAAASESAALPSDGDEEAPLPSPAPPSRLQAGSGDGLAEGGEAANTGAGEAPLLAAKQELLRGHEAAINDVIIAPDGRNIASAATDGVVRAALPSEDPPVCSPRLMRQQRRSRVSSAGAGCRLVGTEGKGVKAWHLDTKRMVAHMRPDPAFPSVADLACSPTDPSFLCASAARNGDAGSLSLWNFRAFRKVHSFKGDGGLCSVCFSSDGRAIAGGGRDGFLRIYDAGMAVSTAVVPVGKQPDGPCFVRFVGPSGSTMVTLSADGVLRAWDLAMLRGPTWTADAGAACGQPASTSGHPRFAPSSDGVEAALSSPGALGHIADLRQDGCVRSAFAQRGAIPAVAWHPSERTVVSGSVDRTVLVTRFVALEDGRA